VTRSRFARAAVVLVLLAVAVGATLALGSRSSKQLPTVLELRPTVTRPSWNPHVKRSAAVTTIEYVIGREIGSCGGATEVGGGFIDHLSGTEGESAGQPIPSEIDPSIAFVELDGIRLEPTNRKPWGSGSDGDATTNASDPNRPGISSLYMKSIHLEISRNWGAIELPDGRIRGPFLEPYRQQTVWPPAGSLVDVQGFVRWDAGHTDEEGHSCSGWEIHPVSAWRLHRGRQPNS
jgi:hypothetical protein